MFTASQAYLAYNQLQEIHDKLLHAQSRLRRLKSSDLYSEEEVKEQKTYVEDLRFSYNVQLQQLDKILQ